MPSSMALWLLQLCLCLRPENSPQKVLPLLFRDFLLIEIVLDFVIFAFETIRLYLGISDSLRVE